MKKGKLIAAALLLLLIAAALFYTRPLSLSQLCGVDAAKIESFQVTYEVHPADEVVQETIGREDPRFLPLAELIASRRYRRTVWNIFPRPTRTHPLREGDFRWELGCVTPEVTLPGGETVSGSVMHLSDFYGKLEISSLGKSLRCTTEDQAQWITDVMDVIAVPQT